METERRQQGQQTLTSTRNVIWLAVHINPHTHEERRDTGNLPTFSCIFTFSKAQTDTCVNVSYPSHLTILHPQPNSKTYQSEKCHPLICAPGDWLSGRANCHRTLRWNIIPPAMVSLVCFCSTLSMRWQTGLHNPRFRWCAYTAIVWLLFVWLTLVQTESVSSIVWFTSPR